MRVDGRRVVAGGCAALVLAGCAAGGSTTGRSRSPATGPPSTGTGSSQVATTATTCTVPSRLRGQDVERLPVTEKVVALTFDAGANADGVPSIRRTLHDKGVRATFFLTGNFVTHYPVRSARIGREYLVGNHTFTHPDLTTLSDAAVRQEVRSAQSLILARTGQDPRRFFRFPFGARNAHAIALLNTLCYVPFRWTVDTLGWKGTSGGITVGTVVSRVLGAATPGEIVLMHVGSNPDDGTTLDADALPTVINRLRARGYTFVPLSRVLAAAP